MLHILLPHIWGIINIGMFIVLAICMVFLLIWRVEKIGQIEKLNAEFRILKAIKQLEHQQFQLTHKVDKLREDI